jgi:phage tail protein X
MNQATVEPRIAGPSWPRVMPPQKYVEFQQQVAALIDIKEPKYRQYITTQGDWWDLISLRCYGMKRGDDHYMHKLIEVNYDLRDVSNFPAGVAVNVPDMPVKMSIPLVPWKSATIITA